MTTTAEEWLERNTFACRRLKARITPDQCRINREGRQARPGQLDKPTPPQCATCEEWQDMASGECADCKKVAVLYRREGVGRCYHCHNGKSPSETAQDVIPVEDVPVVQARGAEDHRPDHRPDLDGGEEAAAYVQGITEAPERTACVSIVTGEDAWEEYSPKERYGVGLIAHVRQYELVLSREVCEAMGLKVGTPVRVAYDRTTGRIRVRITDRNDRDAMHASNPESRGKAKLSLKVSAAGFIKKFGAALGRYSVEVPQKGVAILSLVKAKTPKAKAA